MSTGIYSVLEQYNEFYNATKVAEVDTWPLVQSPLPLTCIVIVYLLFILKLGPQFMATRKPFRLQSVLIVYNTAVVIMSIFLTVWPIAKKIIQFLYQEGCHPRDGVPRNIAYDEALYTWFYLISKFVELPDTVFFILRKKNNQVSFLHVYHHTSVMLYTWIHLKYVPGVQGIVLGFLNSGVHIFMYYYYMLAAMGPAYHKYLWWKKYMTLMQLAQFIIVVTYMSYLLIFNCDLPKPTSLFFISICITYIVLFLNFYYKTYTKKIK